MSDVHALGECLLDPSREQWERMQAAMDLDLQGPDALPYLFEAASLDWSHDPGMRLLIGTSIGTIWQGEGTLSTASTDGLPAETIAEIECIRSRATGTS